ncbi:hypothetical protein EJD97_010828 [Solanum chilense]|uniref:Uncharacterized protein n=1 Tax=Solanum chilense TaxID=4083 RepID=A0A6N2AGB1_SOLCI|nr:hypothetical protein EJD97_010828 [Solanum chilense]
MTYANFSSFLRPFRVLLYCPVCLGMFHIHFQFMYHVQNIHRLVLEQNIILQSSVYGSDTFVPANPPSTQHLAPQQANLLINNVVIRPTTSLNRDHPIRRDRALRIDGQQMIRYNIIVPVMRGSTSIMDRQQMERRNIIESSNGSIIDSWRSLINGVDVPNSSNVDELVNIV